MNRHLGTFIMLGALLLSPAAFAQEGATVKVAGSEECGQYVTDADGRALYMFTTDTQGEGGTEAQVSCTSDACLEA